MDIKFLFVFLVLALGANSAPTTGKSNLELEAKTVQLLPGLGETVPSLEPNTTDVAVVEAKSAEQATEVVDVTDKTTNNTPIMIWFAAARSVADATDDLETEGQDELEDNSTVVHFASRSRNRTYSQRFYEQMFPRSGGWTWYDVKMVAIITLAVLTMVCVCCGCATLCVWCCDSDNKPTETSNQTERSSRRRDAATGHLHRRFCQKKVPVADALEAGSSQFESQITAPTRVINQILAVPEVQRILGVSYGAFTGPSINVPTSREASPHRANVQPARNV